MIRDTNCYFLMREFIYTENYDEKLRKYGSCKVSVWAHENKVIFINPLILASRTSLLSYTSVLIIEVEKT